MTAARKNELWEEVAAVLNAQGPAVKTTSRWRNHWAKMAHKAKKEAARAASEKRSASNDADSNVVSRCRCCCRVCRATGGGKVGSVDSRVLDVLMRTGGVLVSPPEFFTDSEDTSSEEAAGPSGSRRHPPATTAFVVSGPAAVAGPSGLTQPPATPQVLRPTPQVPQPTTQVPQPTTQVPRPTTQVPQPTPQVPQPTPQVPQSTPQVPQSTPREPRAPRRQPRQQELDGAVVTATAEYVRQSQLAEARAQEDARFRQQLLEQSRQHHEAHMQSLRHLGEEVAGMREVQSQRLEVQRQRLEVARRSSETNELLLQLLLAALGHGGSQAPPPSPAPHNYRKQR
nr:proteoglycan 4-like [Dermacentor andersoni]